MESKSPWSRFEKVALVLAILLFCTSFTMYVTHFPLRRYLFGVVDEGADVQIGLAATAKGDLKRQRIGTGEFRGLDRGAALYDLDTIVTGDNGGAELELEGGAKISIGPNAMVKLAFDTRYALNGVTRTQRVQVLQGEVTGVGGSKPVVIQSAAQVTTLGPKSVAKASAPRPKPSASPSRPPAPKPTSAPSPTPPPAATAMTGKLEIQAPAEGKVFEADPQTLIARVPLQWKLPADLPPQFKETSVEVVRVEGQGAQAKREIAFQKTAPNEGAGSTGQIDVGANRPGQYEWRVSIPGTEAVATSRFTVSPEFEVIKLKQALIGGRAARNNRYSGALVKNFSITVGWERYAGAPKGAAYTLRFYAKPEGGRVIYQAKSTLQEYELNRGKVLKGKVYYEVTTPVGSGWTARSKREELSFFFEPPLLTQPENGSTVSIQDIQARGGTLLLTWQKTNFTERYELELATEPTFASVALKHQSDENFFAVRASRPGTYYWRVRSVAKTGASEFSAPFKFTVK